MDKELQEAQKRLESKRVKLKATANHTPLMQNFKTCIHGLPVGITCKKCIKEAKISTLPKDHPVCSHGNPKGYCDDCEAEKEKQIFQKKELIENKIKEDLEIKRLKDLKDNPEAYIKTYNISKKYRGCSFESFSGNQRLIDECKKYQGGGLLLMGNTGCGKTHLSVAVLREMVRCDKIKGISRDVYGNFKPGAEMVTVPDLLLEIRSSFKDDSKNTEKDIIDHFSTIPVLLLDDLGSEKATAYAINTLYIIIDRRDRELLSTIITTNLTLEDIEKKLDARIASRLSGVKIIKINMPDHRKQRKSIKINSKPLNKPVSESRV